MVSDLKRTWMILGALSILAFPTVSCSPAEACADAILVSITSPSPGANLRGYNRTVSVHAWTAGSLKVKTVMVLYDNVLQWSHTYSPALTDVYDSGAFCTFEIDNMSGVLKAKAYAEDGQTYAVDTQTNPIDNAYLISVTRGTCASPGTVTWKYWNQQGTGWTTLSNYCTDDGHLNTACSGWVGSTQGGASGYCAGPNAPEREWCTHPPNYPNHPSPNRCLKGDTPGYTGSDRDYPTITGRTDYGCDGDFGTAKISLPDRTADCGCSRTLIRMHGDQVDGECPGSQTLYPTHGCVRMRNQNVQTLYDIVAAAASRVGYDDIHICIPNP